MINALPNRETVSNPIVKAFRSGKSMLLGVLVAPDVWGVIELLYSDTIGILSVFGNSEIGTVSMDYPGATALGFMEADLPKVFDMVAREWWKQDREAIRALAVEYTRGA